MQGRRAALVERLASAATACEIGIGRRPAVAGGLADRGVCVTATDVVERPVPPGVRFVRDDVVAASCRDAPGETYDADVLYALNCPAELHRPLAVLARRVGADPRLTTLGTEQPVVPTDRETLGDGVVLFTPRLDRL